MSKYIKDSRTPTQVINDMISNTYSSNNTLLQHLENNKILSKTMEAFEQKAQIHNLYKLPRNQNNITEDEADKLKNIYKNHSSAIANIIFNNQTNDFAKKYCWQCRLRNISEYETLDHFLPKNYTDGYPELSFYPNNLIPTCSACNNGIKGPDYKDDKLKILKSYNPYYYDIDSKVILYFYFSYKKGILDFHFYLNRGSIKNKRLKLSIKKQFSKDGLKLLDRYKEEVESELDNIVMVFNSDSANAEDIFNKWLTDQIIHISNTCGINYWLCAFYRGLLNNHDAFVYFQTRKNELKKKYVMNVI